MVCYRHAALDDDNDGCYDDDLGVYVTVSQAPPPAKCTRSAETVASSLLY